ncbi:MAG: ABC transporter substrate-binding protein [Candidatus Lustribacter sp.]
MKRSTLLGAVAAAAVGAPASAAAAIRSVTVLGVPTDGAKAILYAEKAGLFRKRGIDAQISAVGSGAAIFAAVLGGSADFGSGSLFPVFSAYSRGLPLRIVAPASLYTTSHPDSMVIVAKDGPIQTPRDLNGKIVGVDFVTDVSVTALRAWLDQHGGDGKSLRPIELKQTEQVAALDAGRIDATVVKPPYLTVAMESGKCRVLGTPLDAIAPRFLLSCWVATADFIAKNPAVVNGFAAALNEAARWTNAHEAATLDMVASFSGQDPAVLARGIRSTSAETVALSDFQRPLDFAVKYGILDHGFDLSGLLAPSVTLSRPVSG